MGRRVHRIDITAVFTTRPVSNTWREGHPVKSLVVVVVLSAFTLISHPSSTRFRMPNVFGRHLIDRYSQRDFPNATID